MKKIEDIISRYGLKDKDRSREKVYQRAYLYHYLYRIYRGMTYHSIGELFDMDHSTVIHGIKVYDQFKNDKLFLDLTYDLRSEIEIIPVIQYEDRIRKYAVNIVLYIDQDTDVKAVKHAQIIFDHIKCESKHLIEIAEVEKNKKQVRTLKTD